MRSVTKTRSRWIGRQIYWGACLVLLLTWHPAFAHHGTPISYDMDHPMTLRATVTEFRFANPHPQLFFDVVDEQGKVEHWVSELFTNPSFLIRNGWGKIRSTEALKPGTRVILTACRSRAGGNSAVITEIQNVAGESIVTGGRRGGGPREGGAGRLGGN